MRSIFCLASLLLLTSCGMSEAVRESCGSDIEMGCNFLFGYKNSDQDKEIENINKKNQEQDGRLTVLEIQAQNNVEFAVSLQNQITENKDSIAAIKADLATIREELASGNITLQSEINMLNESLSVVQNSTESEFSTVQQQIAVLNQLQATLQNNQSTLQAQVSNVNSNVVTLMSQMLQVNNTLPVMQSNITALQNQPAPQVTVTGAIVSIYNPCGPFSGFDEILLKTSDGKWLGYFEVEDRRFLTVLKTNTTYQTTDGQRCNFTINPTGQITNERI